MYKKSIFKKLALKYDTHMYSGINGILMKYCHKNLEYFKDKDHYSKVLEIGPGTNSHIDYIKHTYDNYFIIDTSMSATEFYKDDNRINAILYDGIKIPYDNEFFDRIIISHVLEHISNPEDFLFEMINKLKNGGLISISLPTDPGLLWRLGRLFTKYITIKKSYNISTRDFEYMMASEHINSIFNLITIIRYNFKGKILKEDFLPFKIKLIDINLFYNMYIIKS